MTRRALHKLPVYQAACLEFHTAMDAGDPKRLLIACDRMIEIAVMYDHEFPVIESMRDRLRRRLKYMSAAEVDKEILWTSCGVPYYSCEPSRLRPGQPQS